MEATIQLMARDAEPEVDVILKFWFALIQLEYFEMLR